MHNIHKLTIISVVAAFLFLGCKKDEIDTYNINNAAAHFTKNLVNYSFVDTPDVPYTDIDVPVTIIGPTADYERPLTVEVNAETTTATQTQYEILSAKVNAGATSGAVTVRIHNDASALDVNDLNLGLNIKPNADFATNIDPETVGGPNQYPFTSTLLVWSNQIKMPDYWLKSTLAKVTSQTYLYLDKEEDAIYGEQNEAGTRVQLNSGNVYWTYGLYSKNLAKILKEVWPDTINVNGYLGKDPEFVAKYPLVVMVKGQNGSLLVHQLQEYVYNYNQAHPDAPLRHSEDAACIGSNGNIATVNVNVNGVIKKYELRIKGCPPILIDEKGNF